MKISKKAVAKNQADTVQTQPITVKGLSIISRRLLPLYERIANDRLYTMRLLNAMRTLDLDRTTRVIQQVLPVAEVSVGAGFSAGYSLMITKKTKVYFNTGIYRPGQLLIVKSEDIRRVSPIMLQLLRLVNNAVNSKLIVSATISVYGPLFVVRFVKRKAL